LERNNVGEEAGVLFPFSFLSQIGVHFLDWTAFFLSFLLPPKPLVLVLTLKGLSHEMDLDFDDVWLVLGLNTGDGAIFKFFMCLKDLSIFAIHFCIKNPIYLVGQSHFKEKMYLQKVKYFKKIRLFQDSY
jgi:hypothetical protein